MKTLLLLCCLLLAFTSKAQITAANTCATAIPLQIGDSTLPFTQVSMQTGYSQATAAERSTCLGNRNNLARLFLTFTASDTAFMLQWKTNNSGLYYSVFPGGCNIINPIHCSNMFDMNVDMEHRIGGLIIGQNYNLVIYAGNGNPYEFRALRFLPRRPRKLHSVRGDFILWNSSSTWKEKLTPIDGDSIFISDSSDVSISELQNGREPFRPAFIQIGKDGNFPSSLVSYSPIASRSVFVNGDLVLSNPKASFVFKEIYIGRDLINNNAFPRSTSPQSSTIPVVTFHTPGIHRVYRTVPNTTDTTYLGFRVNNPACTVQVEYPYLFNSHVILDAGYFQPMQGAIYAGRLYYNTTIFRTKGFWLGPKPVPACRTCRTNFRLQYGGAESIDTLSTGQEWPSNAVIHQLTGLNVKKLLVKERSTLNTEPRLSQSRVIWPKDSIDLLTFSEVINAPRPPQITRSWVDTNIISGIARPSTFSPNVVFGAPGGAMFASERSMRSMSFTKASWFSERSAFLTTVIDSTPGRMSTLLTGDLTGLRGSNYARIQRLSGNQDTTTVTFAVHPTDSITDHRWDLCLAQAPTPQGPWKAISARDTVPRRHHYRFGKARFSDGQYFSLASRQVDVNVKLVSVVKPDEYLCGCPNSVGLPVQFIIENQGRNNLDSVEVGFRTSNQIVNTSFRLRRTLLPFLRDTIRLEGVLGLNIVQQNMGVGTFWVGAQNAQNLEDDTLSINLDITPRGLPFVEQFADRNPDIYYRQRNDSPFLGWSVFYNEANRWRPGMSLSYGYIRGNGQFMDLSFRSPIMAQTISPQVSLPPGRYYVGHSMLGGSINNTPDSVWLEYTTTCGQVWIPFWQRTTLTLPQSVPSQIHQVRQVDSLTISSPSLLSLRFRYNSSGASGALPNSVVRLYYFQIATIPTTNQPMAITQTTSWYPNPSHGEVRYRGEGGVLQVLDMRGQLIHTQQVAEGDQVTTSHWPRGLYLFRVVGSKGVNSNRVVVQ